MTTAQDDQQARMAKLYQAFCNVPFTELLGLQLQRLSPEEAILTYPMRDVLVGNFLYGILHGGVICSVLDMAGGVVVMANSLEKNKSLPDDRVTEIVGKTSTIDLQISYLRPGKGEQFTAKAWMVKAGSKICFTRMELTNQDDLLIATASGTYLAG